MIDGGDSNSLQAYDAGGAHGEGFPKWTTGWTLFSPAAGDLLSNGDVDLVSTTREGYLFAWGTKGPESENDQWWRAQHDEWNTGNYEAVTRPPGAIRKARWNSGCHGREVHRTRLDVVRRHTVLLSAEARTPGHDGERLRRPYRQAQPKSCRSQLARRAWGSRPSVRRASSARWSGWANPPVEPGSRSVQAPGLGRAPGRPRRACPSP